MDIKGSEPKPNQIYEGEIPKEYEELV